MRRVEAFRGEITQLFCWRFFRLSLFRYKSPRSQACRKERISDEIVSQLLWCVDGFGVYLASDS